MNTYWRSIQGSEKGEWTDITEEISKYPIYEQASFFLDSNKEADRIEIKVEDYISIYSRSPSGFYALKDGGYREKV